jgi:hypothetical protein
MDDGESRDDGGVLSSESSESPKSSNGGVGGCFHLFPLVFLLPLASVFPTIKVLEGREEETRKEKQGRVKEWAAHDGLFKRQRCAS